MGEGEVADTYETTNSQIKSLARRVTDLEDNIERLYTGNRRAANFTVIVFYVCLAILLAVPILLRWI
jgi:hypothetical protein